MTTYPEAVSTQLYIDGSWVDISSYVIGDIEGDWGIQGNRPSDRMAYIGGLKFKLNNDSGMFTPGGPASLSGFGKGIKTRVVVTYGAIPYVRFKGVISSIGLPYSAEEISVVPISVSDWNGIASKQKALLQGIETNLTTAEAVETLLENMNTQPDALDIDYGDEELASVFTSVEPTSTVYSELAKLALSEFAYIYLRKDRIYGETLVVEKRHTRVGVSVQDFPHFDDNLTLADGDDFLLADGSELLLANSGHMTFDNMYEAEIAYGDSLINELTVRRNPTRVDTGLSVLFSLDAPIFIAAGQTLLDFQVSYKDPSGGTGRVNGKDMVAPVAGTDYKMFDNPDGSGSNLTANLSFSVEYGAAGAKYRSMTNTGLTGAWVTVLQARGYAVYLDNPVESVLSDQDSIDAHELSTYSINNQYQSNPNITETIAISILNQNKDNKVVPRKIKLCANISHSAMMAFLWLDVGHLIPVKNDQYLIDDNYFIQSVKFKITPGGIITFEWGLVDALLANEEYWELEVAGKGELEESTIISY